MGGNFQFLRSAEGPLDSSWLHPIPLVSDSKPVPLTTTCFLLMLSLLCSSVTKEQQGTGADISSASQPRKTWPVQSWSSQSPASSTAPALPTSTQSQVGWSAQQIWVDELRQSSSQWLTVWTLFLLPMCMYWTEWCEVRHVCLAKFACMKLK